MKLYTEFHVREMLKSTHIHTDKDVNMIISKFTPIELPSDEDFSTSLCYYDLRNQDGIAQYQKNKELYGFDDDDFKDLGNFAKKDCACDNCFYGRHKLADHIFKIQGGNK